MRNRGSVSCWPADGPSSASDPEAHGAPVPGPHVAARVDAQQPEGRRGCDPSAAPAQPQRVATAALEPTTFLTW